MKIDLKLLGGILMVTGTSIGAGMLALPISNAESGFVYSSVFLFVVWALMTAGALLILEVNLCFSQRSNLVSMAKSTLGKPGQIAAWLTYLFLLYALLAAYITGGGDVFNNLIHLLHIPISLWMSKLLFVLILGFIVYKGIGSVDVVNRGLMFGKLAVYVIVVFLIIPHVEVKNLGDGQFKYMASSIMVLVTSFGFASIVPSLRAYFNDDIKKLRQVILYGSLIPLVSYLIWDLAIMGVLAAEGEHGLIAILNSGHATTALTDSLSQQLNRYWITDLSRTFASICMLTSFLGVSLGLTDFLADGFSIDKNSRRGWIIYATAFIPPIAIALFYPDAFVMALSYGGIFCVILLVILPALMAWNSRYYKKLKAIYRVPGGKAGLVMTIAVAVLFIIADILYRTFN
ncbi:MAG: tryptophan/tyrosine permease [Proteobacteria bacterium]|nr:tryptophan/tyrosine permease [Pseudomonadota bacterium]